MVPCPHCGKGHIRKGKTGFDCSNYGPDCQFVIKFTEAPADTTPAQLAKLFKKKFKK